MLLGLMGSVFQLKIGCVRNVSSANNAVYQMSFLAHMAYKHLVSAGIQSLQCLLGVTGYVLLICCKFLLSLASKEF